MLWGLLGFPLLILSYAKLCRLLFQVHLGSSEEENEATAMCVRSSLANKPRQLQRGVKEEEDFTFLGKGLVIGWHGHVESDGQDSAELCLLRNFLFPPNGRRKLSLQFLILNTGCPIFRKFGSPRVCDDISISISFLTTCFLSHSHGLQPHNLQHSTRA